MDPRAIVTLCEDITESKRAEDDFKSRLIASSQDCIKVLDLEGRLLSMNEGGMQALEICDLHPFFNSSWVEFWEGKDRAAAQAAVEAARNGCTGRFIGYFATTVTKQPKWWDVMVSPICDAEGKPERLLAISRDVTKHKQNQEALHQAHLQVARSEERWRSVFDNSAIGVALTDVNGRFLATNPVYQEMVGYTEEELRKLTFLEITHEDYRESNWALAADLFEGKRQQFQIEKQYRRKDGSLIWVRNNVSLVPGTGSVPRFIMALSEDITERKRAEEALRKSEQRQRSLLEINNAIITNLTTDALHPAICAALRSVLPVDRASLTLYQPDRDTLRVIALERDWGLHFFGVGTELSRTDSHHGWVFDRQRPLLRRDLATEWQHPIEQRLLSTGLRSSCVVPLILEGKSIGTLGVGSDKPNQYSEADAEFLCEVAGQVALAAANMKAYEEIAALKARLEKENVYLQEEIRTEQNFEEIVGNSPALLAVLRKVEQVALTDSTVLIYGETGTGKELIARAIHDRSPRTNRALVRVNCSAISAGLVESELFGHLKGAFTGAIERRVGRFELADHGTIFLDEIGELPLETQVKLLRVLQEHEFEPVGSSRPLRVDVRVIAATNRNLQEAVEAGRFRSDLFFRLNVFPLELPPLRERRSDIPHLVMHWVSQFSKRFGKKVESVSQESMARLMSYPWPGNVRELQNVMERAVVLSAGPTLRLDQDLVPVDAAGGNLQIPGIAAQETGLASLASSRLPTLEEMERSHILAALQQARGVVNGPKGAARILNLHPNTLRHRMDKLGIKRSGYRPS
jgi:formate hydrogenlyase transcriptional activator